MAKKNKNFQKNKPKQQREIVIREGEHKAFSHEDYYEANEDKIEHQPRQGVVQNGKKSAKGKPKKLTLKSEIKILPKYFLRIAIILLLAIFAVVAWLNRDNFSPENFTTWIKTKLIGTGVGDGYPVLLIGNSADPANFLDYDGSSVVLSESALTALNSTGREIFSFGHSYNNPAMSSSQGRYLIYNIGGNGYSLVTASNGVNKMTTDENITAAAIAKNGRYALILQTSDYASQLNIHLANGDIKYTHQFAEGYVSAVAINKNGTGGVVAAVQSENGILFTKIYVFDFNIQTPIAEFKSENNVISQLSYSKKGGIYAIGDKKALYSGIDNEFSEFSYDNKMLTAVSLESGTAYVSISAYSHAGACNILVFDDNIKPLEFETEEYVNDLSANATTFAALMGNTIYSFSSQTGEKYASCAAGSDAKGISLVNDTDIYILGVREIRSSSLTPISAKGTPIIPPSVIATPSPQPNG